MKTAYHTADRIAYLYEGRIYFYGEPEALRTSGDAVVQDFIEGRSGDSD
jgi:phospholipid/cholesterol/gamma-HCH transport system ATP-binding protein